MPQVSDVLARTRLEFGDLPEPFRTSIRGDGEQVFFPLEERNLSTGSVSVFILTPENTIQDLTEGTDYTLNYDDGDITFTVAPTLNAAVVVEGCASGIFSDDELMFFVNDSIAMHLRDRMIQTRYRNGQGFMTYDIVPATILNIPDYEVGLIALYAAVQALWALSTDAATDIDVTTSEGTSIPRSQRYSQLVQQIQILEERYKQTSMMLGVGLYAPEVFDLRRISRKTGRLVPLFISREYDDYAPPIRLIPPVTRRDADPDGPMSPWWPGGYGV